MCSHPLWSRVTFLEIVVIVGIAEAHAMEALCRGKASSETGLVVPTTFLAKFTSYMVALESDTNRCTLRRSRQLRKLLPHPSCYQSDHAQHGTSHCGVLETVDSASFTCS